MTEILLATRNENKKRELETLLKRVQKIKILTLNDIKTTVPMIVEDGKTFRQNAVKKAVIMSKFFGSLVLADDSGLEVDALDGRPGVRSARFARKNATDEENIDKLLNLLGKTPPKKRFARFVCHLALARSGKLLDSFEGNVKGRILSGERGENGFGYDPIFVPDGYEKTFAEMTPALKNRISHRAEALKKMEKSIGRLVRV